jgi:flagellar hook-length control protein FliK
VAAAEARPNADLLLAQRQGADAPPGVTPMPSERVDSLPRAPVQPVRLDVAAPIGSREFGAELGNRVVWMATNHHQVAELRIDPPQLGPVELRLSIAHDQASLSIASPHAAVRDAIQASLPRLQDLLQGLGINLGEVTVGAEGLGGGSSDRSGLAQDWSRGEHALPVQVYPPHTGTAAGIGPLRAGIGMIDVYA